MSGFKWDENKQLAAVALAEGHTRQEVADSTSVDVRTIYRWCADPEFSAEVDRLSLMVGIASRAERLRIAMRAVRQAVKEDGRIDTTKDPLEWLKFAQSETDGIKLDLTAISEALAPVADKGQDRIPDEQENGPSQQGAGASGEDRKRAGARARKV
jgi:hypothetical protein